MTDDFYNVNKWVELADNSREAEGVFNAVSQLDVAREIAKHNGEDLPEKWYKVRDDSSLQWNTYLAMDPQFIGPIYKK